MVLSKCVGCADLVRPHDRDSSPPWQGHRALGSGALQVAKVLTSGVGTQ